MYPDQQDPRQQQTNQLRQTSQFESQDHGAWDFLHTPEPPKPESFFSRYKKLIIVASVSILILIGLAIASAMTATDSDNAADTNSASVGEQAQYDGQAFKLSYPASLKQSIDEKLENPNGWLLEFLDDPDAETYRVSVVSSDEVFRYADTVEAVNELPDDPPTLSNVTTTKVRFADKEVDKTAAEYTDAEGNEMVIVYSQAEIDGKYISISAMYRKSLGDITNGFDSMLASFALK